MAMDLSSKPALILVRHSERLDEADEAAWKTLLSGRTNTAGKGKGTNHRSRRSKSFVSDPPITRHKGVEYACEAAHTLGSIVAQLRSQGESSSSSDTGHNEVIVFSSRMLRAVQTAYHISSALGVPVHLSSGLATIISAVQRMKGAFEFASNEELVHYCTKHENAGEGRRPSNARITIDEKVSEVKNKATDAINGSRCSSSRSNSSATSSTTDAKSDEMHRPVASSSIFVDADSNLPTSSWRAALRCIADISVQRRALCIVVAHRETIRKLTGRHLATPYCCIAFFRISPRIGYGGGRAALDNHIPHAQPKSEGAPTKEEDAAAESEVEMEAVDLEHTDFQLLSLIDRTGQPVRQNKLTGTKRS